MLHPVITVCSLSDVTLNFSRIALGKMIAKFLATSPGYNHTPSSALLVHSLVGHCRHQDISYQEAHSMVEQKENNDDRVNFICSNEII